MSQASRSEGKGELAYEPSITSFWHKYLESFIPLLICIAFYSSGLEAPHLITSVILMVLSVISVTTEVMSLPSPLLTLLISFLISVYSFPKDAYVGGNIINTLMLIVDLLESYYAQSLIPASLLAATISVVIVEVYRRKTKYRIRGDGVEVYYPSFIPIFTTVKSISYSEVREVEFSQSIIGKWFKYGIIRLILDQEEVNLYGVKHPERLRKILEAYIERSRLTREDIMSQVLMSIEDLERKQERLLRKIVSSLKNKRRRRWRRR